MEQDTTPVDKGDEVKAVTDEDADKTESQEGAVSDQSTAEAPVMQKEEPVMQKEGEDSGTEVEPTGGEETQSPQEDESKEAVSPEEVEGEQTIPDETKDSAEQEKLEEGKSDDTTEKEDMTAKTENGNENAPATKPAQSKQKDYGREPRWFSRTSLLITAVFSLLCFFPMGLVALYFAFKVKDVRHNKREAAKSLEYARRSTFCSVAAITTGVIALLLILLVIILGITGVVQ